MKRDEIMAMQPGRELDALVAEKVMGFTEMEFGRNDPNALFVYHPWKRRFQPSTDISAAWQVVEKFDKNTFNLNWLDWDNHFGEGWHCKLEDAHAHKCSSAPEAICKAALLAVMEVTA